MMVPTVVLELLLRIHWVSAVCN